MLRDMSWCTERRTNNTRRENDYRDDYDRDFARIIHCPSFRRLQGKTQVLGLGDSDFYRTRLTHSMEVAQVSAAISTFLKKNNISKQIRPLLPSVSLISAIGLAHDLGHPPFGHGGEVALNYCMQKYGGFEANGQTLRILSRLEKYVTDYGLNPTRRMLLGILKYPVAYSKCNLIDVNERKNKYNHSSKPIKESKCEHKQFPWLIKKEDYKPPKCYLDTEADIVDWIIAPFDKNDQHLFTNPPISKETGKFRFHHSLDTSIMETADDICYSVHDLEDAISLGLISKDIFFEYIEKNDAKEIIADVNSALKNEFHSGCESMEKTFNGLFSNDSPTRKEKIGRLIHLFISHCYIDTKEEFCNELLKYNIKLSDKFNELLKLLSGIIVNEVIHSPSVQQLEFKGQRIIIEIFETLITDPQRFLPQNTYEKYESCDNDDNRVRIICDYISGMTDEYAAKLYERLFCPHRGSVFERI